jgi:hypothetical protein
MAGLWISIGATRSCAEPFSIDSLFAEADFVGIVTIVAGELRVPESGIDNYTGVIYKAETEQVLKGDSTPFIYFGSYRGKEIEGSYLVFLHWSRKSVSERLQHLRGLGNPQFDTATAPYFYPLFDGYGAMAVEKWMEFSRGKETKRMDAIQLDTGSFEIPPALLAQSIQGDDNHRMWVPEPDLLEHFISLPESLKSRFPNATPRVPEIGRQERQPSGSGLPIDSVPSVVVASARSYLQNVFGVRSASLLHLLETNIRSDQTLRSLNRKWGFGTAAYELVFYGLPDERDVECLFTCVLVTPAGQVLEDDGVVDVNGLRGAREPISLNRALDTIRNLPYSAEMLVAELSYDSKYHGTVWHFSYSTREGFVVRDHMIIDAYTGSVLASYGSITMGD